MSERKKELFGNTVLFAIAQLGAKVLVFLMVPFYTSVLTTSEYGVSDLIFTIRSIFYPLLSLCISDAVLRFCFKENVNSKKIFSIGVRVILVGGLISIPITILLSLMSFFRDLNAYLIFAPLLFLTHSFYNLCNQFARGIHKVKNSAVAGVIYTFTLISTNIVLLAVFKLGVLGYLIAFVVSDIVGISYLSISCKLLSYIVNGYDKKIAKEMIQYSVPLIPNSLSWWLLDSFSRFIIKGKMDISALGIYSATMRIPTILTVLCDIFSQAWLLSALKDYGSDESRKFIKAVHERYIVLLMAMTGSIILFSYPLAKLLLVGNFSSQWFITPFLFISVYYGALSGFLGAIFSAENKTHVHFTTTIVGGIIMVVCSYLFIEKYGLIVVALSTMMGYFVIWFIRRMIVRKFICLGIPFWVEILNFVLLLGESILVLKGKYLLSITLLFLYFISHRESLFSIIKIVFAETKHIILSKYGKISNKR